MLNIRFLSKKNTEELLKMKDVIEVVENVYKLKSENKATVFPLIFHEFDPGVADMDIKSGWLKDEEIFGLKLVSWFGENVKRGLPALLGLIMVVDSTTGAPIGILDGSHITAIRTGAAGALGAKYLAREDSKTLLIVGTGHVSTFQIAATLELLPKLEKVLLYNPNNFHKAEEMARNIDNTLNKDFDLDTREKVEFLPVSEIEKSTGESDIIITVTPSKKPIIMREWVKPGTHFSCIGADMSGKQEIDSQIFKGARVFADDIAQCMNVGEMEIPISLGILGKEDIAGELGDIIIGKTRGRQNDDEITIYDTTGTALLDLGTAKLALREGEKKGLGGTVNL